MTPAEPLPREAASAPGWMITFADLLSLLLAFFVILFASSTIDRAAWQEHVQPITEYLTGKTIPIPPATAIPDPHGARHDPGYIVALLAEAIDHAPDLEGAVVSRIDDGVAVTLPETQAGDEQAAIAALGRALNGLDNRIEARVETGGPPSQSKTIEADWRSALERSQHLATTLSSGLGDRAVRASAVAGSGQTQIVILDVRDDDRDPH